MSNEQIAADIAVLKTMMSTVVEDVREIKKQTTETNGRVRALEAWRAGVDAVTKQHGAMWAAIGVFASTAGAGIVVALLT